MVDTNATYGAHKAATNPGVSVAGALSQSAAMTQTVIPAEIAKAEAKIHTEKNDGGQLNSGGAHGFLNAAITATKLIGGMAIGAAGGPVVAAVGAAMSVTDAVSFIAKPAAPKEERSFFAPASSPTNRRGEYKSAKDDPINSWYQDASGETYSSGIFVPPKEIGPRYSQVRYAQTMDKFEEDKAVLRRDTLVQQLDDHQRQTGATIDYAAKNNIALPDKVVAGGPKPPAGGPGFIAMPGMA